MSGESQGRSRQCLDEMGTSMSDVVPCIEQVLIDILLRLERFTCLVALSGFLRATILFA